MTVQRAKSNINKVDMRVFRTVANAKSFLDVPTDTLLEDWTEYGLLTVKYSENSKELDEGFKEFSNRQVGYNFALIDKEGNVTYVHNVDSAREHLLANDS